MDLEARLSELGKTVREHREVLLTEEAAKTALVMPFLQALGYNVFNPSEVVPEFTCDVGIKKGEKVDYAVCDGSKVMMLVECKTGTDRRVAITKCTPPNVAISRKRACTWETSVPASLPSQRRNAISQTRMVAPPVVLNATRANDD